MKLLLDTHILLWWMDDSPRLGKNARQLIANRDNAVYFSAASIWEAGIKEAKGLLQLNDDFDAKLAGEPFLSLDITHHHARQAAALPDIHKDPFDRLLVAQSLCEGMALLTQDTILARYGIDAIAA